MLDEVANRPYSGRIPARRRDNAIQQRRFSVDEYLGREHSHSAAHLSHRSHPNQRAGQHSTGDLTLTPTARARSHPCTTSSPSTIPPIISPGMGSEPIIEVRPDQASGTLHPSARSAIACVECINPGIERNILLTAGHCRLGAPCGSGQDRRVVQLMLH